MLTRFCSLRLDTTCVVLGWLGVMSSLVGVVLYIVIISMARQLTEAFINEHQEKYTREQLVKMQQYMEITKGEIQLYVTIVCVNNVMLTVINSSSSFLLDLGAIKKRHLLLLPWLRHSLIYWFLFTIVAVAVLVFQTVTHSFILQLFGSILLFGIQSFTFYIWYAVYSHYKQLQANPNYHFIK